MATCTPYIHTAVTSEVFLRTETHIVVQEHKEPRCHTRVLTGEEMDALPEILHQNTASEYCIRIYVLEQHRQTMGFLEIHNYCVCVDFSAKYSSSICCMLSGHKCLKAIDFLIQ